jgi:hypothetical protein
MLLGTMLVFALGFAIPPIIRRVRLRRALAHADDRLTTVP